mgnify:CR=1 FL=1
MPDEDDILTVHIETDLTSFRADIEDASRLARGFGAALSTAFEGAALKGKGLSDVLKDILRQLSGSALTAALKPLEQGLSAALTGALTGTVQTILPFEKGGALNAGALTPFARGGVVSRPGLFALNGGLGLVGEAGPEAILPLRRGADGSLGVAGGHAQAINVTVNIQTPDVEGFRRARGQIAADLSRTVQRGVRNR